MSEGALDRKRFETIEAYVMGRMSADEQIRFAEELERDAVLRGEVELQRENTLAVELGGLERTLRSVRAEERSDMTVKDNGRFHYFKYAAAVALLIAGALWWMGRPSANERLFAEHYTADPGLPVVMSAGATNDHAFHDAMVAYKLEEFEEARGKWSKLLQTAPTNDTLLYYIACASLSLGDTQAAIPLFQQVTDDAGSSFRSKAAWQLFLAYVKEGDVERAMAMPLENDPTYGERVRAIKQELM